MHKLSILEYPSGKFGFVGSVPPQLAVETDDPSLIEVGARCGIGIAKRIAANRSKYFRARTWETKEAAQAEAEALGFTL